MDLDCTNPVKKDPCSGLCFNCGKLGHIVKVCRGPHAQNVRNIDAVTTLRLAPEDLQLLIESVRAAMVSSTPMMPLCELEGEKTLERRVFRAATSEVCALVAQYRYFGLYIPL